MAELTIFYDGDCPLCSLEMRHLKAVDRHNKIELENIREADFFARFPEIDYAQAVKVLHARTADDRLLTGLEVTERAWTLVGFGPLLGALRCTLTRPLLDRAYDRFARNRHRIGRWLLAAGRYSQGTPVAPLVPDEFKPAQHPRSGAAQSKYERTAQSGYDSTAQSGPDSTVASDDCGCGKL